MRAFGVSIKKFREKLFSFTLSKRHKHILLIALPALGLLLILLGLMSHHSNTHDSSQSVQSQKLTQIERQLENLSVAVSKPTVSESSDSPKVQQQLAQIEQQLAGINLPKQSANITGVVLKSKQAVLAKIQAMQTLLQTIQTQVTPKQYLPVTALPFQVAGIDIWNGRPKATLRVGHDVAPPLGVNDSQDGWTLVHLQFSPAEAIFKNARGQEVKVTL